jgi:hypothetical protein
MAAFDFPAAPVIGQIYTLNGMTFSWNGEAWVINKYPPLPYPPPVMQQVRTAINNNPPAGLVPGQLAVEMGVPLRLWVGVPVGLDPTGRKLLGAGAVISDVPPILPSPGNLWWESDSGNLYIYYNDGTSSQWVLVVPGSTTSTPPLTVVRGYIAGLTLSTPGGSGSFTVQAGVAADSGGVAMMALAAAMTKTQNTWTLGPGGGALDTGSLSVGQWCHVYLMRRPDTGVVDIAFSASAVVPTTGGNIPAAYTQFRRIGSLRVGTGGFWTAFTQLGDEFLWGTQVQDTTNAFGGVITGVLVPLSVPSGIQVEARIQGLFTSGSAGSTILITSPDQLDTVPTLANFSLTVNTASFNGSYDLRVRTDTSRNIRVRASVAGTTLWVNTYGWIDRRGRDA